MVVYIKIEVIFMAGKKKYFDNFFSVVSKYDDVEKQVQEWKKDINDLEKGAKFTPFSFKAKGQVIQSTREDHIEMLKEWITEFEKRLE